MLIARKPVKTHSIGVASAPIKRGWF